jgi:hypothetical protein
MISGSVLGSLIDSKLNDQQAVGPKRTSFSNAVGNGIIMSIKGKSFASADVGLTAGAGVGVGTGIVGLTQSEMVSIALSVMTSVGPKGKDLMDAIMAATVSHLGIATLSTVDSPVYQGVGTIVIGSIAVVESEMASNIDAQLASDGAIGPKRANLSQAIAAGVCRQILSNGTGSLVITGGGPPPPIPGTGAGVGTIS